MGDVSARISVGTSWVSFWYRSGIVLLPHFLAENGILVGSLVLSSLTSSAKFTLKLKATSTRTVRGDEAAANLF